MMITFGLEWTPSCRCPCATSITLSMRLFFMCFPKLQLIEIPEQVEITWISHPVILPGRNMLFFLSVVSNFLENN
ncbi:hypothetical protein D3C86_1421960 [compost metagenome]